MDWAKTTANKMRNIQAVGIGATYIRDLTEIHYVSLYVRYIFAQSHLSNPP